MNYIRYSEPARFTIGMRRTGGTTSVTPWSLFPVCKQNKHVSICIPFPRNVSFNLRTYTRSKHRTAYLLCEPYNLLTFRKKRAWKRRQILFPKCSCLISIQTIDEFHKVNEFRRNTVSLNTTEQHYKCGAVKVGVIMVVISTTKMKTVQFGLVNWNTGYHEVF